MKIRIDVTPLKWATTIFFLLGNLVLIGSDIGKDTTIVIVWEVSINFLAIFSFVMLSFFPRMYYVIDNNGVSFQTRKGKEISYTSWEGVEDIHYTYTGGLIYEGVHFIFKQGYQSKLIGMTISPKQAKRVYENIPKFKEIIDSGKHHIFRA